MSNSQNMQTHKARANKGFIFDANVSLYIVF